MADWHRRAIIYQIDTALFSPIIDRGPFRYQKVNVADSLLHRNSLR